jgi:hypothetical protein
MVEDNLRILLGWDKPDKYVYIYSDILGFTSETNRFLGLSHLFILPVF